MKKAIFSQVFSEGPDLRFCHFHAHSSVFLTLSPNSWRDVNAPSFTWIDLFNTTSSGICGALAWACIKISASKPKGACQLLPSILSVQLNERWLILWGFLQRRKPERCSKSAYKGSSIPLSPKSVWDKLIACAWSAYAHVDVKSNKTPRGVIVLPILAPPCTCSQSWRKRNRHVFSVSKSGEIYALIGLKTGLTTTCRCVFWNFH